MSARRRPVLTGYPPPTLFIAAGFYAVVAVVLYVLHFGTRTEALLCTALLKIDPACHGSTGDMAIIRGLLHPLSPEIAAYALFWCVVYAAGGLTLMAIERTPDLKSQFRRVVVVSGFFYGYILAKLVVGRIYGTSPFATGYVFSAMSFIYLYFLYLVSQHLPVLMPGSRSYAVEYGFMFDSLFALTASALFALGFDTDVNVGLSGAAFVVCSFGAMVLIDALFLTPSRRLLFAMTLAISRLEADPPPTRSARILFSALWCAYKDLRNASKDEEFALMDRQLEDEPPLPDDVEREVARKVTPIMTVLLLVWPVLIYVVYRFIILLILG